MTIHVNKPGLRVLGVAESFVRDRSTSVLAGVVMRGDLRLDGVALTRITVGGNDATDGILRLYTQLDREDINVLILSGMVIAWFNIVNMEEIWRTTGRPVIGLTYEESLGLEEHIRRHFPEDEERVLRYISLGDRSEIRLKTGYSVYFRALGADTDLVRGVLNRFTLEGRLPEPVRAAGLTARAALRGLEISAQDF